MRDTLTALFISVCKLHMTSMRKLLTAKELYPGQPSLLIALTERDGQSQKELAELVSNKAATITVMLKRMEKVGLIQRKPDIQDQRITRVYITEKGREAYTHVVNATNEMEAFCFTHFSEDEKKQFRTLLTKLRDTVKRGGQDA